MNKCPDCKFWVVWKLQPHAGVVLGDCRYHAPTLFQKCRENPKDDTFVTKWPATRDDDYCGKFKGIKSNEAVEV